jgi:ATP-dependent exoDNAse (exonuclease V) beta subunit
VLYVAMTRAIHALYMIIPPHSSKNLPRTFSGLLRAALHGSGPVAPKKTLYQHGDPCWFDKPGSPQPPAEPAEAVAVSRPAIELPPPCDAHFSGETVSPSSLAGGSIRNVSDVLKLETSPAMIRGTLIHAWFELISWLDDGEPDQDTLRRVAQRHNTANLDVDELLSSFQQMLQHPQISDLLHRRHYQPPWNAALQEIILQPTGGSPYRVEVYPERTFAYLDDGQLAYGAIDRLVLLYDGDRLVAADVIDFKTDQLAADDAEAVAHKVQHYGPQLNAYRAAVSKTFGLTPQQVAARLAFVSAGLVADVRR